MTGLFYVSFFLISRQKSPRYRGRVGEARRHGVQRPLAASAQRQSPQRQTEEAARNVE